MNKTHSIIMALCMALYGHTAAAQSFSSLWKQADQYEQSDQPRSRLDVLGRIIAKAEQERSYGHLLKAESQRLAVMNDLSADSLVAETERLSVRFREGHYADAALRSSYAALIGTAWQIRSDVRAEVAADSAQYYYAASMASPEALAATKASLYSPGVIDGQDSRSYQDDMLHVVGRYIAEQGSKTDAYALMHAYYDKNGVRGAACYTAIEMAKRKLDGEKQRLLKKSAYIKSLDSIGAIYKDLPECAEMMIARYDYMRTADDVTDKDRIEFINYALAHWGSWPRINYLRNEKSRITMPSYQVRMERSTILPDRSAEVEITSLCNLSELTMKVFRTSLKGDCDLSVDDTDELKKIKAAAATVPLQTASRRYVGLPDYQQVADTITLNPLQAGVYLLEFSTSNVDVPAEYILLHVSNITVLSQRQPDNQLRIAVLNSTTGQPIKKATVILSNRSRKKANDVVLKTDDKGEVAYSTREWVSIYAYTDGDDAMKPTAASSSYYYSANNSDRSHIKIITDRAIYRPGQVVHCAVVAYTTYHNDTPLSDEGKEIKLTLRDANYQTVAEKTVTTDAFGKATADFALTAGLLTGRFQIVAASPRTSCSFRVEEYKRPTFSVELEMPSEAYQEGDTVRLKGQAKTFSGVPVSGAKVSADISCFRPFWCRWDDNAGSSQSSYATQTDEEGRFEIKVPMETPAMEHPRFAGRYNIYHFLVNATVTSLAGESRESSITIPLSDKAEILQVEAPAMIEKADSLRFCFTLLNSAGKPVDGMVSYTLAGRQSTVPSNQYVTIDASSLPSGRHILQGICGGDTVQTRLTVFSISDKHAPYETHDWFYFTSNSFPADGSPVRLQYGSTDEKQHILYSVFAGNKIIAQGTTELNSQLRTVDLEYKEEYGDGITLTMAWQRDGETYCHSEQIARPLPEKNLKAEWITFRDRLVPGQKETWTLRLTDKNGQPAPASMVAMMYDASLDLISKHSIGFSLDMARRLPSAQWRPTDNYSVRRFGEMSFTPLQETELDFSHFCFDGSLFKNEYGQMYVSEMKMYRAASRTMAMADEGVAAAEMDSNGETAVALSAAKGSDDIAEKSAEGDEAGSSAEETGGNDVQTRANLNETAFFYPQLTGNSDGQIDISFTLPESLTSWRFLALANDKEMRHAQLDATITAQKELMVQPNMPRFVRKGDHLTIASSIANLTDGQLRGTATMELLDAQTEKTLLRRQQQFSVDTAQAATVAFDVDPSALEQTDLLVCRFTAKAGTHTDGEQHYLPVMPEKELVTNTKAITQHSAGKLDINLSELFKVSDSSSRLTIEYTNHPAWLMVQTLPTVADVDEDNAVRLASALYATAIASNIVSSSPEIKKTVALWKQSAADNPALNQSPLEQDSELKELLLSETPWVMEAKSESEQRLMLQTYLDEGVISQRMSRYSAALAKLQQPDGSFSWWKGMEGNRYITTAVAITLARQNMMAELPDNETKMLNRAANYLAQKVAEIVKEIKKELKRTGKKPLVSYLSGTTLDYLYLTSIYDCQLLPSQQADAEYLVDMATEASGEYSIFGKARLAQIFAHYGKQKLAGEFLESARQYSVYSEEMGRYYDTHKANYSWRDYRIPTQVAAIEAMRSLKPKDTAIEEMQRWLLMEKRTQSWDTPLNTVDAVHAFLEGNMQSLSADDGRPATFAIDGKAIETASPSSAIGYTKATVSGAGGRTLSVNKTTNGTSWGAVYAQFMQDAAAIEPSDEGMKVVREVIVNGKAVDSGHDIPLKVGDRIKISITIKADRDYDFVEITDKRAACLEPVSQLSGYNGGFYVAPHDNRTCYFADQMSKGTHIIETEYFVDRAGTYSTGTCTAQCAYSPEYSGRAAALTLSVSEK